MNTIEYLSRFENDCIDLYKTLGSRTANPEVKEIYQLLADTRQSHLDSLVPIGNALRNDNVESELVDRAEAVVNSCRLALLAPDITKIMRNDHDGFNHIIRAEEEMLRLCKGMAKTETNERAKALLDWFVADETLYLEEIEGIYDFVESPRCYLEWGEFSNMRTL